MSDKGLKHDSGKAALSLVPTESLEACARALSYGANKYGRGNYKKGIEWLRILDALMRHTRAFIDGEPCDTESGLSHLDHMTACCAMLAYHEKHLKQLDNRESTLLKKLEYNESED